MNNIIWQCTFLGLDFGQCKIMSFLQDEFRSLYHFKDDGDYIEYKLGPVFKSENLLRL